MKRDLLLNDLSGLVLSPGVTLQLLPIFGRLEANLRDKQKLPQAWEALPVSIFGKTLPKEIKSCWLFVLRAESKFGAERHPNSHQRSFALKGTADFEVFEKEVWNPRHLDALGSTVTKRAISIPENTWHRIQVGPMNFVSLSFHTIEAKKLIEETPVKGNDLTKTKKEAYANRKT